MSEPAKVVHCAQHGPNEPTFVCEHVAYGSGRGFHPAYDPAKLRPDAWCDACEEIRRRFGDWTEESEKLIHVVLICSACYDLAKDRNQRPRVRFWPRLGDW